MHLNMHLNMFTWWYSCIYFIFLSGQKNVFEGINYLHTMTWLTRSKRLGNKWFFFGVQHKLTLLFSLLGVKKSLKDPTKFFRNISFKRFSWPTAAQFWVIWPSLRLSRHFYVTFVREISHAFYWRYGEDIKHPWNTSMSRMSKGFLILHVFLYSTKSQHNTKQLEQVIPFSSD